MISLKVFLLFINGWVVLNLYTLRIFNVYIEKKTFLTNAITSPRFLIQTRRDGIYIYIYIYIARAKLTIIRVCNLDSTVSLYR